MTISFYFIPQVYILLLYGQTNEFCLCTVGVKSMCIGFKFRLVLKPYETDSHISGAFCSFIVNLKAHVTTDCSIG